MKELTTQAILDTLRQYLLKEMNKNNYTIFEMAIKCDISQRLLCNIIYGKSTDIKLSTLIKICQNIKIPYDCIFEYTSEKEDKIEKLLADFILTNGRVKYRLHMVKNTPPRND